MKPWWTASRYSTPFFRALCGCLLLPALSFGQTVWDNGNADNLWNTNANWNPNVRPTATSNVQFNATANTATLGNIQLRGNRSANSLTFNNVDDNFGLINGSGSQTLTLTSGDITRTAGSSNTQNLSFTTLALGGDAAMNIAGTGSLTINSAIIDSGGARSLTKSGAGELILAGANTFSGGSIVSAGTLTLASSSALGTGSTLTLSGGTLKLSTASTTITNLSVTANSTIDFGGANATLNLSSLSLAVGVTLTIINWTAAADFFYTSSWVGATQDLVNNGNLAPMNQVVFSGFGADQTGWDSYDNQLRPNVPEPATYGLWLMGLLTGWTTWRRWRLSRATA